MKTMFWFFRLNFSPIFKIELFRFLKKINYLYRYIAKKIAYFSPKNLSLTVILKLQCINYQTCSSLSIDFVVNIMYQQFYFFYIQNFCELSTFSQNSAIIIERLNYYPNQKKSHHTLKTFLQSSAKNFA